MLDRVMDRLLIATMLTKKVKNKNFVTSVIRQATEEGTNDSIVYKLMKKRKLKLLPCFAR